MKGREEEKRQKESKRVIFCFNLERYVVLRHDTMGEKGSLS
jgi:hypothetical protein